jgi:predicted nucleic acid-binding Zn ribbon protein
MKPYTQVAIGQEKTERAAPSPAVLGFGGAIRICPICNRPLTGRQTSACSDKCRAALSRRRRAEGQLEKNRRVRELLQAAVRVLSETGEG